MICVPVHRLSPPAYKVFKLGMGRNFALKFWLLHGTRYFTLWMETVHITWEKYETPIWAWGAGPPVSWDRMKQKYSCLVITALRLWFSNEWLPGAKLHVMKVRPPFVPRDREIYCCCSNLKKNGKKQFQPLSCVHHKAATKMSRTQN